jgi:hypothetical protein
MLLKFKEALYLYGRNLPLFTAIMLTVWLPLNFFENYSAEVNPPDGTEVIVSWYFLISSMIIGELCTASLVFAIYERKRGRNVTYLSAMAGGVRRWLPLVAANVVAYVFILLGLLALIVPGIVLMLRYCLIPFAVVLENRGVTDSRMRSIQLTAGKREDIFVALFAFSLAYGLIFFALHTALTYYGLLSSMWSKIAFDCCNSVVGGLFTVVLFMYYWEAVEAEALLAADAAPDDDTPQTETPLLANEGE